MKIVIHFPNKVSDPMETTAAVTSQNNKFLSLEHMTEYDMAGKINVNDNDIPNKYCRIAYKMLFVRLLKTPKQEHVNVSFKKPGQDKWANLTFQNNVWCRMYIPSSIRKLLNRKTETGQAAESLPIRARQLLNIFSMSVYALHQGLTCVNSSIV